jgi:predicted permease
MFSILYGALMTDPPYPDGANVVSLQRHKKDRGPEPFPLTMYDFVDYRAQQKSFTDIGAYFTGTMYLTGIESAERLDGGSVTANLFDILRAKPMLGRTFQPGEDVAGAAKVVVLSFETWRDRFSSNPSAIGTSVRVNGEPHAIIGVMPEGFIFPRESQLWVPLVLNLSGPREKSDFIFTLGRLKPGVSVAAATADLATISRRLATTYKASNEGWTGYAAKFVDAYLAPPPKMMLRVMLGAVFLVLLVACANVANLLLDQAVHRTREVGVRIALGATRLAIARQYLAEALVLSAVATVAAMLIASAGLSAFRAAVAHTSSPFWMSFTLRPVVFVFIGVVALLTTIVAGAIPAYQSSRADVNEVLKDDSRGATGFRIGRISNALVTFEIALSCALLAPAGLMVRSVINMATMDRGYTTENVFTGRIGFPEFYTDTAMQHRFFAQLLERISITPGVQSAAIASGLPATRANFGGTQFTPDGKVFDKPEDRPRASLASVTPEFFTTLRTPLIKGRVFTLGDRDGSLPVAVVSQSVVTRYLGGADPIGRRIQLGGRVGAGAEAPEGQWVTVVGVVGDMFAGDPQDPYGPRIFRPLAQAPATFVSVAVRTNGPPMEMTSKIRDVARELNPDIPLYWTESFEEATGRTTWIPRIFSSLFIIFGVVALFLASVGLYAVMSFSVSRRTRELGIRMALGATARSVVRMTFTRGILRLAFGMAIGLTFALGVSRLVRFLLFQVGPTDPGVFASVAAVLTVIGIVACLIPARRATMVDPMVALRRE